MKDKVSNFINVFQIFVSKVCRLSVVQKFISLSKASDSNTGGLCDEVDYFIKAYKRTTIHCTYKFNIQIPSGGFISYQYTGIVTMCAHWIRNLSIQCALAKNGMGVNWAS